MNTWQRSYTPKNSSKVILPLCGAVCLALFVISLLIGSTRIDLLKAITEIFSGQIGVDGSILLYVRLPRALAALLSGALTYGEYLAHIAVPIGGVLVALLHYRNLLNS